MKVAVSQMKKKWKGQTLKKIIGLSRDLVDISHEMGYEKSDKINREIISRIEKDMEYYSLDDLNKISLLILNEDQLWLLKKYILALSLYQNSLKTQRVY